MIEIVYILDLNDFIYCDRCVGLVGREVSSSLGLHPSCLLFREHEIKRTTLSSFSVTEAWCIVQGEELLKLRIEKELHNFGGTGMQEKDKRETIIFSRVGPV